MVEYYNFYFGIDFAFQILILEGSESTTINIVYLTGIEIMHRVIRSKRVFAIAFIVLSIVELGQFSYAQHGQQAKSGDAATAAQSSKE